MKSNLKILICHPIEAEGIQKLKKAEPPTDYTLVRLPNVVCTPRIGSQTKEAQKVEPVLLAEKIISSFL